MTIKDWGVLIAAAALLNQVLGAMFGALRQRIDKAYRKGRHIEEDKSAVTLLAQKVDGVAAAQTQDSQRVRQIEVDLAKLTAESVALTKNIDRLTEAALETQKYVHGAWNMMVRISRGEPPDLFPPTGRS